MAPILGIWASAQTAAFQTSYESIATVTVGSGGANTVTFSSIPSTYQHLQVRYSMRTGNNYQFDFSTMHFNSDTGSNYITHMLSGTGAAAQSEFLGTSTAFYGAGLAAGNTNTSGVFGVGIIDILDYTNTNKNKTIRSLSGINNNDTSTGRQIALASGFWSNTSAINNIVIGGNGGTLQQYSSFALYGIKGV
jgi:hypothetical protein